MHPESSDFDRQTKRWQAAGLDASMTDALKAAIPEHAPGTITARTLARLATWRWQAEQRQRTALRVLFLAFLGSLASWFCVVAWDIGVGPSLVAGLGGAVVASSYAWGRWRDRPEA